MNELLCHLIGDYWLQNDWMAQAKTKSFVPAAIHALLYTLPFLFLTRDPIALSIVSLTHLLIDRFRLAVYVMKLKNWNWTSPNGFAPERPDWLTVWLTIIVDNSMHLLINHLALHLNYGSMTISGITIS
jgi:hypothetical protein